MSTFEIALGVALAVAIWLLVRLYRKHLILRHVFIRSSNWCAMKIDEITASASQSIVGLAMELTAANDDPLNEDDARNLINFSILESPTEWRKQMHDFQDQLVRNGIRPLDEIDLDGPLLNPSWSGLNP